MSVRTKSRKWRSVRINGKVVRKIYKDGKVIFDYSKPLPNPVQGAAVINISGQQNTTWTCDRSGWYRFGVAAAAGGNTTSFGHGNGGQIPSLDLFIEKGMKILAWGASGRLTGAPQVIKDTGGNGQAGAGATTWDNNNGLCGGGARNGHNGGHAGGGGAGPAGDCLSASYSEENGQYGGAGAGIIVYTGDNPADSMSWVYVLFAGGGGGGGGHSTKPRNGGAGGGAGSSGGANRNGAGAVCTGWWIGKVSGLQNGGDTEKSGKYGGYGNGAANALDLRDKSNPIKLAQGSDSNWSTTGWARVYRLS